MPRPHSHFSLKIVKIFFKLLITLASGSGLLYIVTQIHPIELVPYYFTPLLSLIFLSLFSLIWWLTSLYSWRVLLSLAVTSIIGLRLFDFKEWYYPVFVIGVTTSLIYFFTATEGNAKVPLNTSDKESRKKS